MKSIITNWRGVLCTVTATNVRPNALLDAGWEFIQQGDACTEARAFNEATWETVGIKFLATPGHKP